MNRIRKWAKDRSEVKKQADLERLAQLIGDEYQLSQMEADVLERQFDLESPLVRRAFKLRDAFRTWHEDYLKVLEAYNDFELEKERYQARRRSAIASGSILKKALGNRRTKAPFLH